MMITTGKVIAANAEDSFEKLDPAPAMNLVKSWRFKPQMFQGKPVNAVGRVSVTYRMRPFPPDLSKEFPDGPLAGSSITLERGACYGSCPDYRVTIQGDGRVEFDTGDDHFAGSSAQVHLEYNGHNVLLPGHHSAQINPNTVQDLLDRFRAAHFFGLKDEYVAGVTDNPTQKLTVRIGGKNKVLVDYVGTRAGMPEEVRELEDAVDEVAGTARWVSGNDETLTYLDRANFNYRSGEGEKLALAAVMKLSAYRPSTGTASLISGLISRGVPLDGPKKIGATLIDAAARQGNEEIFKQLADRGVLARMSRSSLSEALASVGCSASIARALVLQGADPRFVSDDGTGLTRIRGSVSTCDDKPEKMIELAQALIEVGVPLEARDSLGWTALMG